MLAQDAEQARESDALAFGLVNLVQAFRVAPAVGPPVGEDPDRTAGDRIDRGTGEDEAGDVVRPAVCRLGRYLGAAGVPGEDHRPEPVVAEPICYRIGEFRHGQLVRRFAAATAAG